ncbi:hypothetical protein SDC9_137822 [bioreactor metagenome]|uniref:Uncharacterized protein n=1 Tax=bioreactor metagenome TaxID=1076179 RepID=A0A645DMM9_9ZZZZ
MEHCSELRGCIEYHCNPPYGSLLADSRNRRCIQVGVTILIERGGFEGRHHIALRVLEVQAAANPFFREWAADAV